MFSIHKTGNPNGSVPGGAAVSGSIISPGLVIPRLDRGIQSDPKLPATLDPAIESRDDDALPCAVASRPDRAPVITPRIDRSPVIPRLDRGIQSAQELPANTDPAIESRDDDVLPFSFAPRLNRTAVIPRLDRGIQGSRDYRSNWIPRSSRGMTVSGGATASRGTFGGVRLAA